MNHSFGKGVPKPAALGLTGPHAAADLERLRWANAESRGLLSLLSASGQPDLALNSLIRLYDALGEGEAATLDRQLREHSALAMRLIALLGGSSALADHLIAHPETWRELEKPLPDEAEMYRIMLGCVGAYPATFAAAADSKDAGSENAAERDSASEDRTTAGTYRATLLGPAAERALKETYRTVIMRLAAHDLAGTFPPALSEPSVPEIPLMTVTGLLATLADAALTASLAVAVATVFGAHGAEDCRPVDVRLAVVALGKCGARELNYISDVDVIFVAEPASPRATRLAGEFNRISSRAFFEVDAALRPEGKAGALVRTLDSHLAYYKKWAHTWEFQAQLKARPMTGDTRLGERYVAALAPLVWAASQRDSFVDDVQAMRRRVVENVPDAVKDRELKLGDGGLRDVEFAVQLLQMVHGRSDEMLRVRATITALRALVVGGYVGREDGYALVDAYEFLRLLEHRLQLQRLRRTHTLPEPSDGDALTWLARSCGFVTTAKHTAREAMEARLREVRRLVHSLHTRLFYRPLLNSVVRLSVDELALTPDAARAQLGALGYRYPARAFEHLQALASGTSRRAKIQALLLPSLMGWLAKTPDPDAGLLNYRKLSEAALDRSWFLRMLRDEGVVGQRLMKILGTSPFTADLIISAPDIVRSLGDGAVGPKLTATRSSSVATSLVRAAGRYRDAAKAIQVARTLRRAELARIASAYLLDMMSTEQCCEALSAVWNAVLEAALAAEISQSLRERELDTAPAAIAIIGMGRLGGRELGFGSDADVMFVCEPAPGVGDADAVRWAIGVCDSLRARLSKPSGDPPLDIDVGLRPEGRSGPIVRTVDSYLTYYRRWGEVWEIQALLRADVVAGDREVGRAFFAGVDPLRYPTGGVDKATIREVRRMKARVDNERLPRGADPKTHTKLGRGGLADVEWTAQLLTFMHSDAVPAMRTPSTLATLDAIAESGVVPAEQVAILREAWITATSARNALVLVKGSKAKDQLPAPGPALKQVAGAAGWDPADYQGFLDHYLRVTRRARMVVDELFWGEAVLSLEP